MKKIIASKWHLALKVIPLIVGILVLKYVAHIYNLEMLELNSLFTALISANIFLIGFLMSGVLSDYKESEKIPGDLASSLEAIIDETEIILKNKKSPVAKKFLGEMDEFVQALTHWFHRKERTKDMYDRLRHFNEAFLAFEPLTQANFIVRMKQEQNTIRKYITRIDTIRDTSFNSSGYAIVELITIILTLGLVFIAIDPFYQSMFFIGFVSFILIYMIRLIHDLDDPFDYSEANTINEVSLKPLVDLHIRLKKRINGK